MSWVERLTVLGDIYPSIMRALAVASIEPQSDPEVFAVQALGDSFYCWRWQDTCLLADHPARAGLDSVFPPHPESVFLASLIPSIGRGRKFLDVGVGSGILGIKAAQNGWDSSGVDLCERALSVARMNAQLNEVEVRLTVDDLGRSARNVDLCVANLPFEPTPEGSVNYGHSDGGLYGDDLIVAFLESVSDILAPGGVTLIPSFSLIAGDGSRMEKHLSELDSTADLDLAVIRLSDRIDVRTLFCRYDRATRKRALARLKHDSFREFVIELSIVKKCQPGSGRYRGVFEYHAAHKDWVLPLGFKGIGQPLQETGGL